MMWEIDRIPNLEHRSWWRSELGQHLSRHCWRKANRQALLGGLPEIEVCRERGWDWNTHAELSRHSRLLRHGSIESIFRAAFRASLERHTATISPRDCPR
jgi:hypothetical protein